jgi:hypothetical protein
LAEPFDQRGPAAVLDRLELELRQLGGVSLVSFAERGGSLQVELVAEELDDAERLRASAERVAARHIHGHVVVAVVTTPAEGPLEGRVRLTVSGARTGGDVEVHLAFRDRRVVVRAAGDDRLAVAQAVVSGLQELAPPMPFEPVVVHALPVELGSGTLVLLEDPVSGDTRRGVSGGASPAESTARAVLNALNRYLQPAPFGNEPT